MTYAFALAFPFGIAGGYVLGADALGRDVLSQMMVGGRFLVLRMFVLGAIMTGMCLLLRRRARKQGGRAWPSRHGIILTVSVGLAVALLGEFIIAFLVGSTSRSGGILRPLGTILLGLPRIPPAFSWGGIIATGMPDVVRAPWLVLFPGGGLLLVAAACVALGSGVADVLRVRAERRTPPAPTRVTGDDLAPPTVPLGA